MSIFLRKEGDFMAATRHIPLHVNKGKTVAQCLADRTDYSQNYEKTNNGEFISSYECDPKTADEEFLLSKRQYQHITGRDHRNNVIAYQIRQSFKPGEITPEEANQVGLTSTKRTSTITSFTILPRWMGQESLEISFDLAKQSNDLVIWFAWNTVCPLLLRSLSMSVSSAPYSQRNVLREICCVKLLIWF